MARSSAHKKLGKEGWDRLRRRAGFDTSHSTTNTQPEKNDEKPKSKPTYPANVPTKDHLYDLIDAPGRDSDKPQLFGMAKEFPETTRTGYRDYLHHYLSDEAEKLPDHEDETTPAHAPEHKKRHNAFDIKDYSVFYRFRVRYHAELAEFLGIFVFLAIGYASTCQSMVNKQSGNSTAIPVSLSWGFGQMAGIYVAGGYSGAHLNPVLTLNLWFFRGFPFSRMFSFWIAQFFGALAAAAWIFILYYPALKKLDPTGWSISTSGAFLTSPVEGVPVASAWFNEVTNTALLHIIIFAVGDRHNISPAAGMNALVLGFTVAVLGSSFGYMSPFGMNPTRDFAPRIFLSMVGFPKQIWTRKDWWWITGAFTGPLLGGILGSFAYDVFLFDGPESPINFPTAVKARVLKFWAHDVINPLRSPRDNAGYEENQNTGTVQLQGQPAQ